MSDSGSFPSDSGLKRLTKAQLVALVLQLRAAAPLEQAVRAGVARVEGAKAFDEARAALAVHLVGALEDATGTAVAGVAKELRAVMAELEAAEVRGDADGDTTGPVDPVSRLDATVARLTAV